MKRETFERVIEEHRPRLLKVAENLVGEHAAPDVVQSALETVFSGGQWKREVRDVKAWLTTSVQNAAKMHLRSQSFEQNHEAEFVARIEPAGEPDLDLRIDLQRALTSLPEEIRAAVIAVKVEGVTEAEHAVEAGVNQSTVHRRVNRGLELLKAALNGSSAASQESAENDEEVA